MYHYVEDKQLLQKMRSLSGEMLQTLCHYLKEDYKIGAIFYLVGSGGRNLVLQNENTPIDLDYNLEIKKCEDFDDCRNLKECVRKSFNKVLKEYDLRDCDDSKSCLTTKQIWFTEGNSTRFSIDLCIVVKSKNAYYRLCGLEERLLYLENNEKTCNSYYTKELQKQEERAIERVKKYFEEFDATLVWFGYLPTICSVGTTQDLYLAHFYNQKSRNAFGRPPRDGLPVLMMADQKGKL